MTVKVFGSFKNLVILLLLNTEGSLYIIDIIIKYMIWKSSLSVVSFMDNAFGKKSLPNSRSQIFSYDFVLKSYIFRIYV